MRNKIANLEMYKNGLLQRLNNKSYGGRTKYDIENDYNSCIEELKQLTKQL